MPVSAEQAVSAASVDLKTSLTCSEASAASVAVAEEEGTALPKEVTFRRA